jgi:hypothetical protein
VHRAALTQGLRDPGWIDGQNASIDVRWNDGNAEVSRAFATGRLGLSALFVVDAML